MLSIKNSVQLIGRLGADPQIIQTESGKSLARISLATNEVYLNKEKEKETQTLWHQLVAWEQLAKVFENHIKKGDEICIRGRLNNRSYTDSEGVSRYVTEVVVNELLMMDIKQL